MLTQQDPEGREHLHQAYYYNIKVKWSLNCYISSHDLVDKYQL